MQNQQHPASLDRRPTNEVAEAVYLRIKADIFDFRLLPGDRFTETEMAARHSISRTPIRDALYRLKRDGYVDVKFRSGWHVRPLDFDRFNELYDLRIILECAAIERLCQADSSAVVAELGQVWNVPAGQRSLDAKIVAGLDEAFHATLIGAAGNRELATTHADLTEKIRIIRRLDFLHPNRIAATYQEHGQLLRLLRRRLADDAVAVLRAHITESKQEVRKITVHMLQQAAAGSRAALG